MELYIANSVSTAVNEQNLLKFFKNFPICIDRIENCPTKCDRFTFWLFELICNGGILDSWTNRVTAITDDDNKELCDHWFTENDVIPHISANGSMVFNCVRVQTHPYFYLSIIWLTNEWAISMANRPANICISDQKGILIVRLPELIIVNKEQIMEKVLFKNEGLSEKIVSIVETPLGKCSSRVGSTYKRKPTDILPLLLSPEHTC